MTAVEARWCPELELWEAVDDDGQVVGTYPTLLALEQAICEDDQ